MLFIMMVIPEVNYPNLASALFVPIRWCYNNFMIVEQEVKGTASSSSSSSSHNMAFVSSPSITNEVNTAYGVSTANTQVNLATTQVSTASTQKDSLSMAVTLLEYDKSKDVILLLCFNCHKVDTLHGNAEDLRTKIADTESRTALKRIVNVKNLFQAIGGILMERVLTGAFMAADDILDKLIGSQIPDKSRKGLGFVSYNVAPPPPTWLFSPPNLDLSNSGLEKFQQPEFEGYGPKTSKVKESPDAPLVEELVSDDKLEKKTVAKIEFVRPK
ncbi:hypothetical protein Tco_0855586 [Tanacetum coccineum]